MVNRKENLQAWKRYETVQNQIILEGAPKVWMACAFYTTVWQKTTLFPLMAAAENSAAASAPYRFSVLQLLRICNVRLVSINNMSYFSRRLRY